MSLIKPGRGGYRPGGGGQSAHWKKEIEREVREANERGEPMSALAILQLAYRQPDMPHDKRMACIKLALPHESPRVSAVDVSIGRRASAAELSTDDLHALLGSLNQAATALQASPPLLEARVVGTVPVNRDN
jgi:hypothetical protein